MSTSATIALRMPPPCPQCSPVPTCPTCPPHAPDPRTARLKARAPVTRADLHDPPPDLPHPPDLPDPPDVPDLLDRLPLRSERFDRGERVVGRQIRMQGRHGYEAVTHGLVIGAIVRLPLVLSFFEPVVRAPLRIVALRDRRHVVALRLDGHTITLRLAFRDIDVQKRSRRKPTPQRALPERGCGARCIAEIVVAARL